MIIKLKKSQLDILFLNDVNAAEQTGFFGVAFWYPIPYTNPNT